MQRTVGQFEGAVVFIGKNYNLTNEGMCDVTNSAYALKI